MSDSDLRFYAGSRLLTPLSHLTGIPIDQVNFISCQLIALSFAYLYRACLKPQDVGITIRHIFQLSMGISLTVFCYGHQILYLLGQSVACLLMIRLLPQGSNEKLVFMVALGYLCAGHIYRLIYDYGGYTMDITGPLMINTQRMSSLAYSLGDGQRDHHQLSPNMRKHAVRKFPSLLEFFSYIFCFHNVLVGPFTFYDDYIAFVEGADVQALCDTVPNGACHVKAAVVPPSPLRVVVRKLGAALVCVLVTVLILPRFPIDHIADAAFLQRGIVFQSLYIMVCTTLTRQKYYFAWKLSEAVNNNAGLGFRGYDSSGQAHWDLIDNADITEVETCTSLKVVLDKWNITTSYWLRHVVYERVGTMPTLAVFAFSAFWHGFYPGYYITFFTASLFILAARQVRRKIRPLFQRSSGLQWTYEVITFVTTRLGLAYLTFPFVYLGFWPCITVYRRMYFWLHGLAAVALVVLTFIKCGSRSKVKSE